jgi:transposase
MPYQAESSSGDTVTAPQTCPSCGRSAVTSGSKKPSVETYWRCESCGEIWHAGRRDREGAGRYR